MQLAGDLTAITIADLICLLVESDWEGTVRVRRSGETAMFVIQGGLVLFPLPAPSPKARSRRSSTQQLKRRRKREELRGNKHMMDVVRWTRGSFRCFARQIPRGFIVRRSLVVRLERLKKYCKPAERSPSGGWESGVGLEGEVLGRELPALMRVLTTGHWNGVLAVRAPRAELEILVHGQTTYVRRSDGDGQPLLVGPAETIRVTWRPRPVPEVGLRPEQFMRTRFGQRPNLQVA